MGLDWTGVKEFRSFVKRAPDLAMTTMAGSLEDVGEDILLDSKQNYVPVDAHTLEGSGHVKPARVAGTRATVEIGFGGNASAYALAIHEHPSQHSPPSWKNGVKFTVGGPQFLRRPVLAAEPTFRRDVGRAIARRLT
jgi:hypothetical protein